MKYVVDLDALKDCLDFLDKPVKNGNLEYVCLQKVQAMIDKFPKEEYRESMPVFIEKKENTEDLSKV